LRFNKHGGASKQLKVIENTGKIPDDALSSLSIGSLCQDENNGVPVRGSHVQQIYLGKP